MLITDSMSYAISLDLVVYMLIGNWGHTLCIEVAGDTNSIDEKDMIISFSDEHQIQFSGVWQNLVYVNIWL